MSTERKSLLQREPVLVTTLIRSALLLGTAFGLRLEPDQIAAVLVFTEAALAILVRGSVTSPASAAAGSLVLAPSAAPDAAFGPRRPDAAFGPRRPDAAFAGSAAAGQPSAG